VKSRKDVARNRHFLEVLARPLGSLVSWHSNGGTALPPATATTHGGMRSKSSARSVSVRPTTLWRS